MSSEQYTRCPHCKATFEVSEKQLSAAAGKVRCGACMEVFDAVAYLIPQNGNETLKSQDDTPSEIPTPSTEHESHTHETDDEELIFEDSDDEKESAKKQSLFDDSQLSDSLKKIDSSGAHAFSSEAAHHSEVADSKDEEWTAQILKDDTPTKPLKQEPSLDLEPQKTSHTNDELIKPSADDAPQRIDFYYEEEQTVHRGSWLRKSVITLACLALTAVLAAQIAWFHYERLAQYPLAKQGFQLACEKLGCKLPELVDLEAIKSSNLVVRSHPLKANTLIIDVVLTNTADFDQEFPRLAMYFSDINGKTIAQQIVEAKTYLNDDTLAQQSMQREKAMHISLEVEDPGKQAVNYKIRFFPAKKTSG